MEKEKEKVSTPVTAINAVPLTQAKKCNLNIIKGRSTLPPRVIIYGVEGIGKSTLASTFPDVLIIDIEDRTRHINVDRIIPIGYQNFIEVLDTLILEKGSGYKTVAIDTLDWLQALVMDYICLINKQPSIESFAYGRGWVLIAEQMRKVIHKLDKLNKLGVTVVGVAHSTIKKFEDPLGGSYDRYTLKLLSGDRISVADMFKEWCDVMVFLNYVIERRGDEESEVRYIFTKRTMRYDAKNSHNLDDSIPLDDAKEKLINKIIVGGN